MADSVTIKEKGGGGAGAILVLGIGALVYMGAKMLNKDVIRPIVKAKEIKTNVQRMQITQPKAALVLKKKEVHLQFIINNPNDKPLKILAITGVISIHPDDPKQVGFNVGEIDRFVPIEIKPLSATPVFLVARLRAVNALAYLAEVMMGKWKGQNLVFKGTVNANGTPYPVTESIKLSV